MIIIAISLVIYLIYLTIKKAKVNINTTKHTTIRISVLIAAITLIILGCYLSDKRSGLLGALYLSYYFFGAWLLYILAESISLFIVKQNKLAQTNLIIFIFSTFVIGLGTMAYFNSLH